MRRCFPSSVHQSVHSGQGGDCRLGRKMAALGLAGPALLIASKTVIARLAAMWKSSLNEAGIEHVIRTFGGECSPVEIKNIKSTIQRCTALSIIGAGGGKVIDTASSCCNLDLPVISCPTVASSDAPCSAGFRHLHG